MSSAPRQTILHVITGLNDGGAEGALFRLCNFDQHHLHVVVSLMDAGKYGPLLTQAGISVHCLGMPASKVTMVGLWRLWRLMRQQQPDVVQTWLYHADLIGGVVARLANVRRVVWGIRHSNLTPGTVKRSTILTAKLCAVLSRFVPSHIVCCSQQAAAVHVQIGYEEEKFRIIPNGYHLTQFCPNYEAGEQLIASLGLLRDKPLIGMVARFDAQKDHANLFAALALLVKKGIEFHALLVGTGIDESNEILGSWLKLHQLENKVSLLGRRNDIHAVMNAIDVHVLSSLGEAFPNVLAEAMACGTPCVTTDVGDAALIVGDTGWVVPPSDAEALARGIEAALNAKKQPDWQDRKLAARQHIEQHFSIERMVAAYNEVWREALQ